MIYLGNLTTKQIEERLEINLTDEERLTLESDRQNIASPIKESCWHCFDIPFIISCGSMDTAVKVHNILKKYSSEMKGQLQIGVQESTGEGE